MGEGESAGVGEVGKVGEKFLLAQCSMPNAQCPMPNAQCPMTNDF
jgi:cobaltochelatase CobN